MIDIKGLDKASVLVALYNHSQPQGMGFLQAIPGDMSRDEAVSLLKEYTYFDYLHGRIMKIDLASDETFNERLYDRDLGDGAAQRAIESLKNK